MLVGGSLFVAYMCSYLYLWRVSPEVWPVRADLPALRWPAVSALLLVSSALLCRLAFHSLAPRGKRNRLTPVWVMLSALVLVAALGIEGVTQWQAGVDPTSSSHDAMVFMAVILSAQLTLAIVIMSAFVVARHYSGKLDRVRWASLENTHLLIYYTVGQALLGLLLVHGFPRVI